MRILLFLIFALPAFAQGKTQFIYNGFEGSTNQLNLNGLAKILPSGLLQLTNYSIYKMSSAFYPHPMIFKPKYLSFSTSFVFAMNPRLPQAPGNGIFFVISPYTIVSSCAKLPNYVFAVELVANNVSVYVNESIADASAAYYSYIDGVEKPLLLSNGEPVQIWIDYNEAEMLLNVTLAPLSKPRPSKFLLSKKCNLSSTLVDYVHVGFTSCSDLSSNDHYILGWSWNKNGKAQDLDLHKLPSLPHQKPRLFLLIIAVSVLLMIAGAVWFLRRKTYEELFESWEKDYAPQRLSYKDLYAATKGFKNSELLGVGGFGKVFKGVLHSTSAHVAVKRVSHNSKQGLKEFVAEISTMRRLRHRNMVQLLGYCRRKGELLLVYDYMPNGSLDKLLFGKDNKISVLSWSLRFKKMKGVTSALLYLHEELQQVVLHRDVKASNVLLDEEMNARLGDFGLARLYDHNKDAQTTHVVGTIGYIAPEVSRTRKPTTSTDVYAYGMFLLDVVCGRRPIGKQGDQDDAKALFLSDWVYECWKNGEILKASDPKMERNYQQEKEMELVLKLGLLCLHPKAEKRPTMRLVNMFLNGSAPFPAMPCEYDRQSSSFFGEIRETSGLSPPLSAVCTPNILSSTNSVLQYGR